MRSRLGLACLFVVTSWSCATPHDSDDSGGAPEATKVTEAAPSGVGLSLERAIAATDPRYQPAAAEGGIAMFAPSGRVAQIDDAGARVTVGGTPLRFGVEAIRRGEQALVVEGGSPTVDGAVVQRTLAPGVTEWWQSLPRGLEHGVTIEERPLGSGALEIDVRMEGLVAVAVPDDATRVALTTIGDERAQVATYAHLEVIDADDARVPARMRVVDDAVRIEVEDADARYPLVIDPLLVTLEGTLAPSDPANGDELGTAVAISADGTRAVVGAPNDHPGGSGFQWRGTARVFVRSGSTWTFEAMLSPATSATFDRVGHSVAISSNGSRVIVGAPGTSSNAGAAYVFSRSATTWTEEATLLAETPTSGDRFGWSVDLSATAAFAIVGARDDDTVTGTDAGSAVVFSRSSTMWTRDQTFLPTDATADERFGVSVAMAPDGSRSIVGARLHSLPGITWAGSARVFLRSGSTWTQEATLRASDPETNDQFGYAVGLTTDADRAIVGVHFDDVPGATRGGTARVFSRTGVVWAEESLLTMTGAAGDDFFGNAVAIAGDGSRAIVSATGADTGGSNAGTARVFVRTGTTWADETTLVSPTPGAGDEFGTSVGMSSDGTRVIVGAPFEEPPAGGADDNQGGAHVFVLAPPTSPNGTSCSLGTECTSGSCVDGVCCENGCGSGSTTDCRACVMSATGAANGLCRPITMGTVCRGASGVCDVAEMCDGTAINCPANGFASTGQCRAAASGGCDVAESCNGTGPGCPADGFEPDTTVCRAVASGGCDVAEQCTGSSAACPADGFASSGVCRPASAAGCDVAESCNGSGAACPADGFASSATVCRPTAGDCDVAENCSGSGTGCPADGFASTGVCRPAVAGGCDVAESCNGAGAACPADGFASSAIVCRTAAGVCDVAESCTGSSSACPSNTRAASGTLCRAASDVCDAEETCNGTSNGCPADALEPRGVVCRDVMDVCDVREVCTGSSAACPSNAVLGSTRICRAAAGDCDVEERCDGLRIQCPVDDLAGPGTICRSAAGACDVADACSGASASCPADARAMDGASCADAQICDGVEVCRAGSCQAGTALACDDSNLCTTDMCSEPDGCDGVAVPGCCNVDRDCSDGDVCTTNACSGPGGRCASSPITNCCVADADCDDGNECTTERCDVATNRCEHGAVPGCCAVDADCDDSNGCTTDACDAATGSCSNADIAGCCLGDGDCDDTDTCTLDACDLSTNACTHDALAGCCLTDAACADTDACTADSCDPATATCVHDPVTECCAEDADCDDADACTADRCDATMCLNEPIAGCGEGDGGVPADAGGPIDDAGALADAGVLPDAATGDAGDLADASTMDGGSDPMDGGCGCRVQAPSRAPLAWLGLLGALGFVRRRRRG